MQLGVIGLGRMGANIVRHAMRSGHQCVVYDRDRAAGDFTAKLLSALRFEFGGHEDKP